MSTPNCESYYHSVSSEIGSPPDPARFSTRSSPPDLALTVGDPAHSGHPTQQNGTLNFVVLFGARDAPSQLNKIRVLSGWAVGRVGAALRVGLPSLGPGAVVRPLASFGAAAPPRRALRCALPLGPLGGGCRCAPPPLPPSPCGGGGCGDESVILHAPAWDSQKSQDTASVPPPRIRDCARGPGPRPISAQDLERFRTQGPTR